MGKKKIKIDDPYALKKAFTKGDLFTKLSVIICVFGCIMRKQVVKGILMLLVEVGYILFMVNSGIHNLSLIGSLGTQKQGEVWNEAAGVYEYTQGDNSVLILLYAVATIFLTLAFIVFWALQLKHAYKLQTYQEKGREIPTLKEDIASLFDKNLHSTLMFLPSLGILFLNIIPLCYMILMAFTNYSKKGDHQVLFDWVGLKVFAEVLDFRSDTGKQFWGVLIWTIVWAIFATFLNYIMGMILAMLINRKRTRLKSMWRFFFVLSVAVPQFVSLMIISIMLQDHGAVNVMLQNAGIISSPIPWLSNAAWARVTVIVVNLWVGIPYTMLQVTGILQNIPAELYEAAKVDGAGPVTIFFKITLPYMLFVTTPYLITAFTGNVNNFNVIYLLTGGGPTPVGNTAGKTDLLVTWLFKLTVEQQYFNVGAVIGILTFVVLSIIALVTYRNSGSYKNEEAFM
ncbi:MAG: sugar ABC transporter permease [Lachnospiraceae bacterium]|nr:sugar ABC transporter permease [Lachnospiraceae bacterium]